jgi:hypothetical protein
MTSTDPLWWALWCRQRTLERANRETIDRLVADWEHRHDRFLALFRPPHSSGRQP